MLGSRAQRSLRRRSAGASAAAVKVVEVLLARGAGRSLSPRGSCVSPHDREFLAHHKLKRRLPGSVADLGPVPDGHGVGLVVVLGARRQVSPLLAALKDRHLGLAALASVLLADERLADGDRVHLLALDFVLVRDLL